MKAVKREVHCHYCTPRYDTDKRLWVPTRMRPRKKLGEEKGRWLCPACKSLYIEFADCRMTETSKHD